MIQKYENCILWSDNEVLWYLCGSGAKEILVICLWLFGWFLKKLCCGHCIIFIFFTSRMPYDGDSEILIDSSSNNNHENNNKLAECWSASSGLWISIYILRVIYSFCLFVNSFYNSDWTIDCGQYYWMNSACLIIESLTNLTLFILWEDDENIKIEQVEISVLSFLSSKIESTGIWTASSDSFSWLNEWLWMAIIYSLRVDWSVYSTIQWEAPNLHENFYAKSQNMIMSSTQLMK